MTELSIKDISPLMRRLWHNKWIILFVTLSGFLAGMAVTADNEATLSYVSTSSVCVTYTTYQEQMRGSTVITSYSDLVTSFLVCERAVELLGDTDLTPGDIRKMVENWVGSNSYVMYIKVTAEEPQMSVRVANALAEAFTEKVSSVSGNNSLQVLDIAHTATEIINNSYTTNIIASVGPFVIVCAWIILKELTGGKIRLLSQCADDTEELLGILPDIKKQGQL